MDFSTVKIDWDAFKVRCSAIKKILSNSQSNPVLTELQTTRLAELRGKLEKGTITEKQKEEIAALKVKEENGKKLVLSDTCIEYLMEVYAWETEQMIPVNKESMDLLQLRKGKKQELQAGALLGFVDDVVYKQHKDRISNEFLSGEIDFYLGNSVYEATNVSDIKNSWDYPTYLKKINTGLESGQEEQLGGYGDITGAKDLFICNALVDAPDDVIEDMKWKVAKKFDALTIESPEFLEEWEKWERSMKFSHISPYKRIHKIRVEPFNEFKRQKVYDRVKMCREWLWLFHESHEKMNQKTIAA